MKPMEELSQEITVLQGDLVKELESKQAEFSKQPGLLAMQEEAIAVSDVKRDGVLSTWERTHAKPVDDTRKTPTN